VLAAALRAPSAHNAQPWRIVPGPAHPASGTARYELHYDHHDYLPHDPDDRDAYLCMGALLETLALAATRLGWAADVAGVLTRDGSDLHVADVTLSPARTPGPVTERRMADWAAGRHTNRSAYTREPLPAGLRLGLAGLGCALVEPARISRLVSRAGALSWQDRRFVADLERFCHPDQDAPRGMTPAGLMLARYEWSLLNAVFSFGRLPGPLGVLASGRDIRLLRTAPAVAVLGANSLAPADLVAAGRRLLRAWSLICGQGFAYHPISVSVDRPETCPEVAAISGIPVPAAVFRIGRPRRPAPPSNRVSLADVWRLPTTRDHAILRAAGAQDCMITTVRR
jgi:hypothetical protein